MRWSFLKNYKIHKQYLLLFNRADLCMVTLDEKDMSIEEFSMLINFIKTKLPEKPNTILPYKG